jgi:xeroderma pigmentosum group C-complementing protein
MIRQQRHKADATCQLALGLIRNRYLNDRLLQVNLSPTLSLSRSSAHTLLTQARLLSIVPLHLQNAFFTFSKRTHPNERDRARLFDAALKDLLSWWYQYFDIIEETGIRRRPVAEVERELVGWAAEGGEDAEASTSRFPWEELGKEDEKGNGTPKGTGKSKKGKGKGKERDWGTSEESWEVVKGVNSFVRAARAHKGSRDMSVQVFTCICRALDIPARLVFSLQPVDWRAPSAAAKTKGKKGDNKGDVGEGTTDSDGGSRRGRGTASATTLGRDSGAEGWDNGRVKLAYAVPQVNLRKSKSAKRVIHRSPSPGELVRPHL